MRPGGRGHLAASVIGLVLQSWCIVSGAMRVSPHIQTTPEALQQGSSGDTDVPISPKPSDLDRGGGYKPEDGVVPPKVLYAPNPEFTDKARRKKLGGTCVVSTLVDEQGTPRRVEVVKSIADGLSPKLRSAAMSLDQNAVKAVQQYRFQPATRQGKPVPYKLKIEVSFRIY